MNRTIIKFIKDFKFYVDYSDRCIENEQVIKKDEVFGVEKTFDGCYKFIGTSYIIPKEYVTENIYE